MRVTGNGIIFAAIATAGVILLSVAARMSSLASELEQIHQEYDHAKTEPSVPQPNISQGESAHQALEPHYDAPPTFPDDGNRDVPANAADAPPPPVLLPNNHNKNQAPPPPSSDGGGGGGDAKTQFFNHVAVSVDWQSDLQEVNKVTEKGIITPPPTTTTTSTTTTSTSPIEHEATGAPSLLMHLPATISNASWPFADILYNPRSPCLQSPKAVSAVLTLPKERKVRDWIRQEIANVTSGRVVPVFPLGRPPLRGINDDSDEDRLELEQSLLQEAQEMDDVIIADFVDSYEDLPRKTTLAFDWFERTCSDTVRWLVKEDADVVINWDHLLEGLETIEREGVKQDILNNGTLATTPITLHADVDPVWLGHRWLNMPVIHNPKHRNFEEVPFDLFPPYCSGPSYVMNNITAKLIMEQRRKITRYFRNEDAMLGLLLLNLTVPVHDERFIVFIGSGWRRAACQKETESISECDCNSWWTYHCGGDKPERDAALKMAYQCANQPFYQDSSYA